MSMCRVFSCVVGRGCLLWTVLAKIPWRRKRQPTPVLLPGESHRWRSLVGYSPWGSKESDTTEWHHFHFHFEWSSGFPHFLQFKSEFGNKEFMTWSTVNSRSCFFWLYRASPSSAVKNIINLILVLTIWWYPCVELSLVLLEEGVCYDQCIPLAKLY